MAKTAIDAKLYRNTGNYNTPTWTAIDSVRDVQFDPTWDAADAFTRGSRVKEYAKILAEIGFTAVVQCSDTDAGYLALMDAHASSSTVLDLLMLDGSSTSNGAQGVRFDAGIFGASQDQSIGNVLYRDFDFKPSALKTNAPKRAVVTNSVPVFTSFS